MKLLTYDPGTGPRCGVLQGDAVVDVAALIGADARCQTCALCWIWAIRHRPGGRRPGRQRGGSTGGVGRRRIARSGAATARGARLHRV